MPDLSCDGEEQRRDVGTHGEARRERDGVRDFRLPHGARRQVRHSLQKPKRLTSAGKGLVFVPFAGFGAPVNGCVEVFTKSCP